MEAVRDVNDDEFSVLIAELRERESIMRGKSVVAQELVTKQQLITYIVAERHFGPEPHPTAEGSLAQYFHLLLICDEMAQHESLSDALEAARKAVEAVHGQAVRIVRRVTNIVGSGSSHS